MKINYKLTWNANALPESEHDSLASLENEIKSHTSEILKWADSRDGLAHRAMAIGWLTTSWASEIQDGMHGMDDVDEWGADSGEDHSVIYRPSTNDVTITPIQHINEKLWVTHKFDLTPTPEDIAKRI